MMRASPNSTLERLVDEAVGAVLFGHEMIELPTQALRSLTIDIMCATAIRDPRLVELRLLFEFRARLDQRLRAAVDDRTGDRWRAFLGGLEQCFPTRH